MSKKTETDLTPFETVRNAIDEAVKDLNRDDYRAFLDELAVEIRCRIDGWEEERE